MQYLEIVYGESPEKMNARDKKLLGDYRLAPFYKPDEPLPQFVTPIAPAPPAPQDGRNGCAKLPAKLPANSSHKATACQLLASLREKH